MTQNPSTSPALLPWSAKDTLQAIVSPRDPAPEHSVHSPSWYEMGEASIRGTSRMGGVSSPRSVLQTAPGAMAHDKTAAPHPPSSKPGWGLVSFPHGHVSGSLLQVPVCLPGPRNHVGSMRNMQKSLPSAPMNCVASVTPLCCVSRERDVGISGGCDSVHHRGGSGDTGRTRASGLKSGENHAQPDRRVGPYRAGGGRLVSQRRCPSEDPMSG